MKVVADTSLLFLVVLLFASTEAQQCGICDPIRNVRCINKNTIQLCSAGVPMAGAIATCAAGTVCSINSATASGDSFCQVPAGFPSTHDCESQCIGICPADVNEPGRINFICTGPNRYRYCSEAFEDDQDRYCPLGQVCTIDAPCVSATTNSSLCSRPIDPTPNANTICIGKLDRAKYPLVPPDPYCQRYVYCRYHGGIAKGTIYRCPSRQQFNKLTGRCERAPVANCWNIF